MTEKKKKDPMHEKSASIEIKLSADSGYKSTDSGRISPHQWALINRIVHCNDDVYGMLAYHLGLKELDREKFPNHWEDGSGRQFTMTEYGFKRKMK